eukprot:TRINITY_DN29038_c0_g1_i1.p1 TRINITY_DN29038_c0_g1~~TRINITY_DN29038_c0_g1_i1.p1  ORF type:complete len:807 (-),score=99.39 TRINITY_DN29038_c0_g1_i1:86-2485(-)
MSLPIVSLALTWSPDSKDQLLPRWFASADAAHAKAGRSRPASASSTAHERMLRRRDRSVGQLSRSQAKISTQEWGRAKTLVPDEVWDFSKRHIIKQVTEYESKDVHKGETAPKVLDVASLLQMVASQLDVQFPYAPRSCSDRSSAPSRCSSRPSSACRPCSATLKGRIKHGLSHSETTGRPQQRDSPLHIHKIETSTPGIAEQRQKRPASGSLYKNAITLQCVSPSRGGVVDSWHQKALGHNLQKCSSAPALCKTDSPVSQKQQVRISVDYPREGSPEHPGSFGAMPQLSEPLSRSSCASSRQCSPTQSQEPSRAVSRRNSRSATPGTSTAPSRGMSRKTSRRSSKETSPEKPAEKSSDKKVTRLKGKVLAVMLCERLNALRAVGRRSTLETETGTNAVDTGDTWDEGAGHQCALLSVTLSETSDSIESLHRQIEGLQAAEEELGGSKHATARVAERTAQVIKVKIQRLQTLKDAQDNYVSCVDRRASLLELARQGSDPEVLAQEAHGFRRTVDKAVHRDGHNDGRPQDADKCNWPGFLQTFGLPDGHSAIVAAASALNSGVDAWADSCLAMAQEIVETATRPGVTYPEVFDCYLQLCRGNLLARKAACMTGFEECLKTMTALEVELKENALQLTANHLTVTVKRIVEEDSKIEKRADEEPQVGGMFATDAAEKVLRLISESLKIGVHPGHDSVRFARDCVPTLKAEGIRRDAKAMIYACDQEFAKKGYIEDAASNCADQVELLIRKAVHQGLSESHPKMQAAYSAAKELRELEGWRKREANAAKRRASTNGARSFLTS